MCLIHLKRFDEAQKFIDGILKDKPDYKDFIELKEKLEENR